MKKTALLLPLLLFAMAGNSQELNCKKFRTGKFYYPTIPGKISLRKESIQESYDEGKLAMLWDVKWINECEYELKCTKVMGENYPIKIGDRIAATIIKTDGECFTTSLIFYNEENPKGLTIPGGEMCIQK